MENSVVNEALPVSRLPKHDKPRKSGLSSLHPALYFGKYFPHCPGSTWGEGLKLGVPFLFMNDGKGARACYGLITLRFAPVA